MSDEFSNIKWIPGDGVERGRHQCRICKKLYIKRNDAIDHLESNHLDNPFKCHQKGCSSKCS